MTHTTDQQQIPTQMLFEYRASIGERLVAIPLTALLSLPLVILLAIGDEISLLGATMLVLIILYMLSITFINRIEVWVYQNRLVICNKPLPVPKAIWWRNIDIPIAEIKQAEYVIEKWRNRSGGISESGVFVFHTHDRQKIGRLSMPSRSRGQSIAKQINDFLEQYPNPKKTGVAQKRPLKLMVRRWEITNFQKSHQLIAAFHPNPTFNRLTGIALLLATICYVCLFASAHLHSPQPWTPYQLVPIPIINKALHLSLWAIITCTGLILLINERQIWWHKNHIIAKSGPLPTLGLQKQVRLPITTSVQDIIINRQDSDTATATINLKYTDRSEALLVSARDLVQAREIVQKLEPLLDQSIADDIMLARHKHPF